MEAKQLTDAISLFQSTKNNAINEVGSRHSASLPRNAASEGNLDSAMLDVLGRSEVRKDIVKIKGKRVERKN